MPLAITTQAVPDGTSEAPDTVMKAMHAGLGLLVAAATSCAGTVALMRLPQLWPLLPRNFLGTVEPLFAIHTQEGESSFEFLSVWLLLFLIASMAIAAATAAWRHRKRLAFPLQTFAGRHSSCTPRCKHPEPRG